MTREQILSSIPNDYKPFVHAAVPTIIGLFTFWRSVRLVDHFGLNEMLIVIVTMIAAMQFEWLVHRYVLHKPFPLLGFIHRRHVDHHIVYTDADMQMNSKRELYLILMPAYAIVAVLVTLLPMLIAIVMIFGDNTAEIVLATMTVFFLSYEWLHLSYHLPKDSFVGSNRVIRWLREHHQRHHTPELSQSFNFNVTFPLFDWLLGTKI